MNLEREAAKRRTFYAGPTSMDAAHAAIFESGYRLGFVSSGMIYGVSRGDIERANACIDAVLASEGRGDR